MTKEKKTKLQFAEEKLVKFVEMVEKKYKDEPVWVEVKIIAKEGKLHRTPAQSSTEFKKANKIR